MYVKWYSGDNAFLLYSGSYLSFSNTVPGTTLAINEYNLSTYQSDSNGKNNQGSVPNVRYVNGSTADYGTGSVPLQQVPQNKCTVHLRLFSGSGVATTISNLRVVAVDRLDPTLPPRGMVVMGAELGDPVWTHMSGTTKPLLLSPSASSVIGSTAAPTVNHDRYICLSCTESSLLLLLRRIRR
jgi:hypothetical protein